MQEHVLLLMSTCLGLLFISFPVRSACLCAIAITVTLWNHIPAACNYLGQQTITVTLCIVRLVPSFLTSVSTGCQCI